jgi:CubicO group peptidase (beta-lactamase class C family)
MPRSSALLLILACAFPVFSHAQSSGRLPADFDRRVESALERFEVPGVAVAVVKDGQVLVARGYGTRALDGSTPVDSHTLFGIASNTKAFTALALGLLVEEGKIEWDAPVVRYLPWFQLHDPWVTRELTVRDLLVHRSGLGLGAGDLLWWPPSTYNREQIARRLRFIPAVRSFRSGYAYDNVLYLVAGLVIEEVSGKSWEDFVSERLLRPVGMLDATVTHSAAGDTAGNVAITHAKVDGKMQRIPPFLSDNTNPAGGINASASDMARWLVAQLDSGRVGDRRLWSQRTTRDMWSLVTPINPGTPPSALAPQQANFNGYGLGLFVRDYRGEKAITHTGGLPGYLSRVIMIPRLKAGVAVLGNAEAYAFEAIAWQAIDALMAAEPHDWEESYAWLAARSDSMNTASLARSARSRNAKSGPALPLASYAGTYRDQWYGDVAVEAAGNKLVIRMTHTPSMVGDLEHWQYETFKVRWRDRTLRADAFITFQLDAEGKPVRATMEPESPAVDFSFDYQDLRLERVETAGER